MRESNTVKVVGLFEVAALTVDLIDARSRQRANDVQTESSKNGRKKALDALVAMVFRAGDALAKTRLGGGVQKEIRTRHVF